MQVKSSEEVLGMRKAGKLAREVMITTSSACCWLGCLLTHHRPTLSLMKVLDLAGKAVAEGSTFICCIWDATHKTS